MLVSSKKRDKELFLSQLFSKKDFEQNGSFSFHRKNKQKLFLEIFLCNVD
jgi:hypothetical protein